MLNEYHVIDGSFGEGGGQILRTALAIAALTGKSIKVINIRAKRENPGLRPQHLLAAKSIAEICSGKLEGAKIGSSELIFSPSKIRGGVYEFDVGTAGSVTLVLQAILPALAFAEVPSVLKIRGGTSVPKSPTVDYIEKVLLFHLRKMGLTADIKLLKHGFYPKGGGLVEVKIEPLSELKPIILEDFGEIDEVYIKAYAEGLPRHVTEREVKRSLNLLLEAGLEENKIKVENLTVDSHNVGNYFFIYARGSKNTVVGYDSVGMKGLPAEKVAEEPTLNLLGNVRTNAAVDMFAGDQLLIWLALTKGTSIITTYKYTMHAYTTLHILKELMDIEFEVEGKLGSFARIKIRGSKL